MAQAAIPVEVFNPGQIFACMGFLEVADALLGGAEGGFDWSDGAEPCFEIDADGGQNPFEAVLEFLAKARITEIKDSGEPFPGPREDGNRWKMKLPVELKTDGGSFVISHWADGSTRNEFKLYSGNRSACKIAEAMLKGDPHPPQQLGLAQLWEDRRVELIADPFNVSTAMRGSFNLDPRGAWTAIDAGYSPNDQKHFVAASPAVELLAAMGLEHARPDQFEGREVRYGVWRGLLPPAIARPALGGVAVGVPIRRFRFTLDHSGKNKVVTFAQEEPRR